MTEDGPGFKSLTWHYFTHIVKRITMYMFVFPTWQTYIAMHRAAIAAIKRVNQWKLSKSMLLIKKKHIVLLCHWALIFIFPSMRRLKSLLQKHN